jgi:hypothetical protein
MGKIRDLTGQRFGRLIAIKPIGKNAANKYMWLCQCDCGNLKEVEGCKLTKDHTKSCGCLQIERTIEANTKHGMATRKAESRLYNVWRSMRKRCNNSKDKNYKHYGGRGIKVCEEWEDLQTFCQWALSNGYDDTLEIDRIDVNGNYEPQNCRFITHLENSNNKRNTRVAEIGGEVKPLSEWVRLLGVGPKRILNLINSNRTHILEDLRNQQQNCTERS